MAPGCDALPLHRVSLPTASTCLANLPRICTLLHRMPPPALAPLQSAIVSQHVEPEAAAAIAEVLARHGKAAQELVDAADVEGCSQGHTLKDIMTRLVLASDALV